MPRMDGFEFIERSELKNENTNCCLLWKGYNCSGKNAQQINEWNIKKNQKLNRLLKK